jgi:uncharacterized CHY-type Zn-finger protein
MSWDYDRDEGNVAVQERPEEDGDDRRERKRPYELERMICPRCRMLLSVFETRMRKCSTCRTSFDASTN